MHRAVVSIALLLSAFSGSRANAEEPLGTLKVDPVALITGNEVPGQETLALEYQHYRYLFANEENLAKFKKDPSRYEIQLGGACGSMGVLSGRGTPDLFAVHDSKIYIFASEGCRERFLSMPEQLLQPPDKRPEVSEDALAAGETLLSKMLQGVGGQSAVSSIKNFRRTIKKQVESGGQTYAYQQWNMCAVDGSVRRETKWDDDTWVSVASKNTGFFQSASSNDWMAPVQSAALRREMFNHSVLGILLSRERGDFIAVSTGTAEIAGEAAALLTVYFDETTTTLAVDTETGRVLQLSYQGPGPGAVIGELTHTFADFEEIHGLMLPRSAEVTFNGEPFAHSSYSLADLGVNEDYPPTIFDRPEK